MLTRLLSAVLGMALAASAVAQQPGEGQPPTPPAPPKLSPFEAAQKAYARSLTDAEEARRKALAEVEKIYNDSIKKAKEDYLAQLNLAFKESVKSAVESGNLDEANRIDGIRKLVEAELKIYRKPETTAIPLKPALETTNVVILPGNESDWIKPTREVKSAESRDKKNLQVTINAEKGIKIRVASTAPPGTREVLLKFAEGPEAMIRVIVPAVTTLITDRSQVEFVQGKNAEATVNVTAGTAQSAIVIGNPKGLTATVGDMGSSIRIAATKDLRPGIYEVIVTGSLGTTLRITVTVKAEKR